MLLRRSMRPEPSTPIVIANDTTADATMPRPSLAPRTSEEMSRHRSISITSADDRSESTVFMKYVHPFAPANSKLSAPPRSSTELASSYCTEGELFGTPHSSLRDTPVSPVAVKGPLFHEQPAQARTTPMSEERMRSLRLLKKYLAAEQKVRWLFAEYIPTCLTSVHSHATDFCPPFKMVAFQRFFAQSCFSGLKSSSPSTRLSKIFCVSACAHSILRLIVRSGGVRLCGGAF